MSAAQFGLQNPNFRANSSAGRQGGVLVPRALTVSRSRPLDTKRPASRGHAAGRSTGPGGSGGWPTAVTAVSQLEPRKGPSVVPYTDSEDEPRKRRSPDLETRATKKRLVEDESDDDDEPQQKVTPASSFDGDAEEWFERYRKLIAQLALSIEPRHLEAFKQHYDHAWIRRELEENKGDQAKAFETFRLSARQKFPCLDANDPPSAPKRVCDRCDGAHDTACCPFFAKDRDDHPDARKGTKNLTMGSDGGNAYLAEARVAPQPGDGSCLFHSLSFGYQQLRDSPCGAPAASALRGRLMDWLLQHEDTRIADTPVKDWVKWDSGVSVANYAKRMRLVGWGGGIEMAAFAHLYNVDVHVYERTPPNARYPYKRISRFEKKTVGPANRSWINVLYRGGVHYDALVAHAPPVELPSSPGPKSLRHASLASSGPATPPKPYPPTTPSVTTPACPHSRHLVTAQPSYHLPPHVRQATKHAYQATPATASPKATVPRASLYATARSNPHTYGAAKKPSSSSWGNSRW